MISAIRAEFRKLLTIRSTYLLTIFMLLILILISVIFMYHSSAKELLNPFLVQQSWFGSINLVGLIGAIVAILSLAHEYRYNTINYSLTLTNHRTRVLTAKAIVLSVYAIFVSLIALFLVIGSIYFVAHLRGLSIGHQNFDVLWGSHSHYFGLIFQSAFYTWALAMASLIVTVLFKNLVASMAFIFVFPSVENLVVLISKSAMKYMPFYDLGAILRQNIIAPTLSIGKSMLLFCAYLVVFGVLAWVLFLRRDAN